MINLPEFYDSSAATSIFNSDVTTYLSDSKKIARDILNTQAEKRSVGKVHYYSGPSSYFNWSPFVFNYNSSDRRRRNDDNDKPSDALRVIVGGIALVTVGVAAWKLGESISQIQESNEELSDMEAFRGKVNVWKYEYAGNKHVGMMSKVIEAREQIFDSIRSNAKWRIALLVTTVAASSIALTGAFVASSPLMAAGAALGVGTGIVWLFRSGLHNSRRDAREADKLNKAVRDLENEERMIATPRVLPTPVLAETPSSPLLSSSDFNPYNYS